MKYILIIIVAIFSIMSVQSQNCEVCNLDVTYANSKTNVELVQKLNNVKKNGVLGFEQNVDVFAFHALYTLLTVTNNEYITNAELYNLVKNVYLNDKNKFLNHITGIHLDFAINLILNNNDYELFNDLIISIKSRPISEIGGLNSLTNYDLSKAIKNTISVYSEFKDNKVFKLILNDAFIKKFSINMMRYTQWRNNNDGIFAFLIKKESKDYLVNLSNEEIAFLESF